MNNVVHVYFQNFKWTIQILGKYISLGKHQKFNKKPFIHISRIQVNNTHTNTTKNTSVHIQVNIIHTQEYSKNTHTKKTMKEYIHTHTNKQYPYTRILKEYTHKAK